MKKIAVIVVALFAAGCSLRLGVFPVSRIGAPMGIPKKGWELCWDAVDAQMTRLQQQRVPKMPLSKGELDCLRSGLMEMCGEAINGNSDVRNQLYQPSELKIDPDVFTEYMGKHADKCEEEGYRTELVEKVLEEAEKGFNAAQICQ